MCIHALYDMLSQCDITIEHFSFRRPDKPAKIEWPASLKLVVVVVVLFVSLLSARLAAFFLTFF